MNKKMLFVIGSFLMPISSAVAENRGNVITIDQTLPTVGDYFVEFVGAQMEQVPNLAELLSYVDLDLGGYAERYTTNPYLYNPYLLLSSLISGIFKQMQDQNYFDDAALDAENEQVWLAWTEKGDGSPEPVAQVNPFFVLRENLAGYTRALQSRANEHADRLRAQ